MNPAFQAIIPQVTGAAANAIGNFTAGAAGAAGGRFAGAQLDTGNTTENAKQWIKSLDPAEQARIANELLQEAQRANMESTMQSQGFGAGLGNQVANLNTERAMAVNAQQNAANNVANQLNVLANRSNANAQMINQAMLGAAQLAR
jgi:hypothetical protein